MPVTLFQRTLPNWSAQVAICQISPRALQHPPRALWRLTLASPGLQIESVGLCGPCSWHHVQVAEQRTEALLYKRGIT